jgi:hypothetical protein
MTETIALISAVTALCAVILAPLVSMWSADKQARVSVLSTNRQAWINALRDTIAEFSSIGWMISLHRDTELVVKSERLFYLEDKIHLMLNPTEAEHQQLASAITEARRAATASVDDYSDAAGDKLKRALETVRRLTQPALKQEWEKVKRVE